MKSLRGRLSLSMTLAVTLALIAQWGLVSRAIRHAAEGAMRSRMEHDAETIALSLVRQDGAWTLPIEKLGTEYRQAYSGHYFRVFGAGELASRSLWDYPIDEHSCATGESSGPRSQPLIVVCMPLRKGGENLMIWVAEDRTEVDRDVAHFQGQYTIVSVLALFVLLAAQTAAVYASLAPLRAAVRSIQNSDGFAENQMPAEIVPFAREIRRLIEALRKRLETSRKTAGNLAHEQKTHLAAIAAALESLSREPHTPDTRALLLEIGENARRLKAVAERHLARSALAGEPTAGKPFDWSADFGDLRTTLLRIYAEKHLQIDARLNAAGPRLEREDGLELLGILLDNACRFAARQVVVTVSEDRVSIEDDGPGCTEEQMRNLAMRGARVDERTESGIGLSIAREIAEGYGRTLSFSVSSLGGLCVEIREETNSSNSRL